MNWLICRFCMMVVSSEAPECKCKQSEQPHLPKTQCLMLLQLPVGYEIVKVTVGDNGLGGSDEKV